jgi:TPR repeat protein
LTISTAAAGAEVPEGTNIPHVDRSRYLEAAAAAQRGDYVVAYCFWRPLAEKGDAESEYALGWMYHNGYGLVPDDRAAKAWWEKAAAQGDADAMFSLGTLYSVGSDAVPRDYSTAMRLWLQAAAAGHENARFALRELMKRNLPELASLTRSLRAQYPRLLGFTAPLKNIKGRRGSSGAMNKTMGDLAIEPTFWSGFSHTGELIAVAAGYRPESGWAVEELLKEGKLFITGIRQ